MTEPADEGGAGSDPSMLKTTAVRDGDDWVINGRKAFITGAVGAGCRHRHGAHQHRRRATATMFLVDLPHPAIRIERVLDTIDSSMPGGHAVVRIDDLRVADDQMLGEVRRRLPTTRRSGWRRRACRTACAGSARRGARTRSPPPTPCRRQAFGKPLIDHEGVGFMLADNLIDLKQAELMIDWCAAVLDTGALGHARKARWPRSPCRKRCSASPTAACR